MSQGFTGMYTSFLMVVNDLSDLNDSDTALINLGGTDVGKNIFKVPNPSAIRFLRVNADNSVALLTAADFLIAIGAAGASDLQDAYDLGAADPAASILTDATRKSLKLKRGSGLDADNVLVIMNGAGTETAYIRGDGDIFGQAIFGLLGLNAGETGGTTGSVIMYGTTAGKVTFTVPDNITNYTLKFPNAIGAIGRALRDSDGLGNLEWFTPGTGDALVANPLSQFAATTSLQLAGVISDETGYSAGAVLVFNIAPVLKNPTIVDTTTVTKVLAFDLASMTAAVTLTIKSQQSVSRTLEIPVVGSGDFFMTNSSTATVSGAKTFNDQTLLFRNPANTFSYTIVTAAITAARTLNLPLTTQTETIAVRPTTSYSNPANPTGTSNTTGLMMGLAIALTPRVTGSVTIMVSGNITNSAGDSGASMKAYYGTGVAPVNGAALTGSATGNWATGSATTSGATTTTYIVNGVCFARVTGLTVGTAYWFDIAVKAVTTGTASVTDLSFDVCEY